jgi:hypothetical protein
MRHGFSRLPADTQWFGGLFFVWLQFVAIQQVKLILENDFGPVKVCGSWNLQAQ